MRYLVPDYYARFHCKCGSCRHSCCDGWTIRISMKEYYQLLGLPCSKKLRAKLDCALKFEDTSNHYGDAIITTDWNGICMLHRTDGLCALQSELKEKVMPEVCRLYPRHARTSLEGSECSCSNSCEAVIELLMQMKEPMYFIEADLPIDPKFEDRIITGAYALQEVSISILQDRSKSLPERLILLGKHLTGIDYSVQKPEELNQAFTVMQILYTYFNDSNRNYDHYNASQNYYRIKDRDLLIQEVQLDILHNYQTAATHLDELLPDWQLLFEQLLVNHMFFNRFPYTDNKNNQTDAYLTLTLMYGFLRFQLAGYLSDKSKTEDIVDSLATMFRLIEHSNFRSTALKLYKSTGYPLGSTVPELLLL